MRKAAYVVYNVRCVVLALPNVLPAYHRVRLAPLVTLWDRFGASASRPAGVKDNSYIFLRDVRKLLQPRCRGKCGDVDKRVQRKCYVSDKRGKVEVIQKCFALALRQEVAHDCLTW